MSPNDWIEIIKANGVSALLILIMCYFAIFKLWPWCTTVWFPAMQKRQDQQATAQSLLQQSISQLSAAIASMPDKFASQLMGNISQAVSPLLDQVNTRFDASQASTINQLQQLFVNPSADIAAIRQQLSTLGVEERVRHEAVLTTITALQNHLTQLIVQTAQPKLLPPPPIPQNELSTTVDKVSAN